MKNLRTLLTHRLAALLWLALAAPGLGQNFDCGSDGSFGPINVGPGASIVLPMPSNGIFHCTTITIGNSGLLRFTRNAANTPVYLLATGDVFFDVNSRIDISGSGPSGLVPGQGGPGGYDGGHAGLDGGFGGDGHGPGGGRRGAKSIGIDQAGHGAYRTSSSSGTNSGAPYGNPLLIPLIGGSGGGGADSPGPGSDGSPGGGGGGAILIASNTRITFRSGGSIIAHGGGPGVGVADNAGAGGAIRLVSPRVFGNGLVSVSGGRTSTLGLGRLRVDSIFKVEPGDPSQNFALNPNFGSFSIGSVMTVFPPSLPRLDIVEACGSNLVEGTLGPVLVTLPFGSTTNRTVTVQARDFNALVPIRVALKPASGNARFFDDTIDNTASNPATKAVNVTLPVNTAVHIEAFSR